MASEPGACSWTQAELDRTQQQTLEARNSADRLDAEADDARNLFGQRLTSIDESAVRKATSDLAALDQVLARADRARQGLLTRLLWTFALPGRLRSLEAAIAAVAPSAHVLGVPLPQEATELALPEFTSATREWGRRLEAASKLLRYRQALNVLSERPAAPP